MHVYHASPQWDKSNLWQLPAAQPRHIAKALFLGAPHLAKDFRNGIAERPNILFGIFCFFRSRANRRALIRLELRIRKCQPLASEFRAKVVRRRVFRVANVSQESIVDDFIIVGVIVGCRIVRANLCLGIVFVTRQNDFAIE